MLKNWNVCSLIFLIFLIGSQVTGAHSAQSFDVKNLVPGRLYESTPRQGIERLSIYCYKGIPKHVIHLFITVTLNLNLSPDKYMLYRGHDEESVLAEHDARRSWFRIQLFSLRPRTIRFEPFNASCIGVATPQDHTVQLQIIRIDFWRVLQFFAGLFLFFAAPRLSNNAIFFYACGIGLGVTSSFLVLVYFLSKLIPKRGAVLGFMIGGGTIGMYLMQLLWQNVEAITVSYQNYILAYLILTSVISFFICYRYGPVTDRRTLNLIKWTLQVVGLSVIFFSSYFTEAILGVIILLLCYYNFPTSWIYTIVTFWKRKFPPRPKLLSAEEYHQVVSKETTEALDKLRKFCSSPDCNQWKTVLRLKNPQRFAEFIEGSSHLSDDELMLYESSQIELNGNIGNNISDDDSD